ncbi:hypothetical protein CDAR_206201 [Caerostris darwini]|uniref:Uncharacterized protein n=1 Tax=Caerostris darwini TaxID=1538125 RepID=A0AAV4W355_9ARAC|nr:hypothetical protein CDAR_206201 [Caerostris darwini]
MPTFHLANPHPPTMTSPQLISGSQRLPHFAPVPGSEWPRGLPAASRRRYFPSTSAPRKQRHEELSGKPPSPLGISLQSIAFCGAAHPRLLCIKSSAGLRCKLR